jgi:NAD-dependent histone deacetylase SIR2
MIMSAGTPYEVVPAETYQLDSDEYDSEEGAMDISQGEYDQLAEEGEYILRD